MTGFQEYARYYDLLYRDKDYAGEVQYVHHLIQAHLPEAQSILNLGCGSGRHDRELARLGYRVTGVDLAEEMLVSARREAQGNEKLAYHLGDVRSVRLGQKFDAVVSLFHVMSYQVTGTDLLAALATAREHLKPGGLFVFDCWYGPGVLTDRPGVRVKELEDDTLQITRIAQPTMHPNENLVDVNYHLIIRDKAGGQLYDIKEVHRMRYLFLPEVEQMLGASGLELLKTMEWMTDKRPDFATWSAVFVCRLGTP